jgi:hypothetical protein
VNPRSIFGPRKVRQFDFLDDETVLQRAASDGRILVTHDKRTLPRHFASFLAKGNSSPGVLLVIPQDVPLRIVVDTLVLIWVDDRPLDWENAGDRSSILSFSYSCIGLMSLRSSQVGPGENGRLVALSTPSDPEIASPLLRK